MLAMKQIKNNDRLFMFIYCSAFLNVCVLFLTVRHSFVLRFVQMLCVEWEFLLIFPAPRMLEHFLL